MKHEVALRIARAHADFSALAPIGQEIFRSNLRSCYRSNLKLGEVRSIAEDAGFEITGIADGNASARYRRNLAQSGVRY